MITAIESYLRSCYHTTNYKSDPQALCNAWKCPSQRIAAAWGTAAQYHDSGTWGILTRLVIILS